MTVRTAFARYDGLGRDGRGQVSTQSGALRDAPYDDGRRFGEVPGASPEELIAAAHASCFTMALSFALAKEGFAQGTLETRADVTMEQANGSFIITRSDLELTAHIPGISRERLSTIAEAAKRTCPVSKLLNADISLKLQLKS